MADREERWKSRYLEKLGERQDNENITTDNLEDVSEVNISFLGETFNFAILDSGCTRTVCGREWISVLEKSLSPTERRAMENSRCLSSRSFRFGDGSSEGTVKVPASLVGTNVLIETDVVDQDIPMLLKREAMKTAATNIDFVKEEVYMLGRKQKLVITSTGHYCIPLSRNMVLDDVSGSPSTVLFTNESCLENEADAKKIAKKLHEQFAHPSSRRLIKLIKDGGVVNQSLNEKIEDVEKNCHICRKFKKKPLRPVVCFPRAKTFNENLAIDLKCFSGKYMLHILDQFTRFSRTIVINDKKAATVLKGVTHAWLAIFGSPKSILADNGLEFNNAEFRDLCDYFGVHVYGTAAESPWSNGTNERHNGLFGHMVERLIEQGHSLEDAVCWATSSKNSLANIEGYSPNQLVFGINPNYPSVLRSELPALEECDEAGHIKKILKAQSEARECFIKAECDERLKRALKRKVRKHITSLVYEMGDRVYYQRDGKWKGPGIVVGKENKNVMVKHGGSYFRVHPCSLQGVESNENEPGEDKDTDKKTGENRSERSDKESSEIPQQRGVKTRSAGMVPQIHQREECTAEDGQEGSSITCRRISGDALEEGNTENTSTEPED